MTPRKPLKLFNGRWDNRQHAYIAAKSRADAVRLCREYGFSRITPHEFRVYFSECWGYAMNGITPERGLWLRNGKGPPQRFNP